MTKQAKVIKSKDVTGNIDKMFERLSPAMAKKIDNGGTRPKTKSANKKRK